MKSFLLLGLLVMSSLSTTLKEGITSDERALAVKDFQRTKERLLNDVRGLSPQQLNFKADTGRWSIAQCVEHIALAESMLFQWMQSTMAQPATPEKASEVKITNEQMLKGVVDRSKKAQAPEMLKPVGRFASTDAALAAFTARRDSTINYLQQTQDDLKNHFVTHPAFGTINCYQVLLLITAHSERHTLQIEEVKASPGYPKQ